jgi:hypothetical protein
MQQFWWRFQLGCNEDIVIGDYPVICDGLLSRF